MPRQYEQSSGIWVTPSKRYRLLSPLGMITIIILCCVLLVLGIYGAIASLQTEERFFILGVIVSVVLFMVFVSGLSVFVFAYSILRRREEAEDDAREIELMRAVSGMKGNQTIHVQSPQQLPQWRIVQDKLPRGYSEQEDVVFD